MFAVPYRAAITDAAIQLRPQRYYFLHDTLLGHCKRQKLVLFIAQYYILCASVAANMRHMLLLLLLESHTNTLLHSALCVANGCSQDS
jgi:hypothetical protein